MTLFTEIFPVNIDQVPPLTVYTLSVSGNLSGNAIGRKLRFRLQNSFKTHWYWDEQSQCLLTDTPISQKDIETVLNQVWAEPDERFKDLEDIRPAPNIQPSLQGIANFVAHALLEDVQDKIDAILEKAIQEKERHYIRLVSYRFGWVVYGQPAVSVSVRSKLEYKGDLRDFMQSHPNDELVGLHVIDKTKPNFGSAMEITAVVGKLGEKNRRKRLLKQATTDAMRQAITRANDDSPVVRVKDKYDYVADVLKLQILNRDYDRFGISERLQIPSIKRAGYIKPIAKVIQDTKLVGPSYSTSTHPDLFPAAADSGYTWNLVFAHNQIKSIRSFKDIYPTLQSLGPYKPANDKRIRITIVNTTNPSKPLDIGLTQDG